MMILLITLFITITSFGITGPVIPAYLESINQGGMASGMIIAIFASAQLLFAPLGGKWTDQFGRRKMIIIGLMLITAGGFLFYLTDTLWVLYVSRVISGIGDAIGPISAGMLYDINLVFPFILGLVMLGITISITAIWHLSRLKKTIELEANLPVSALADK